MQDLRNTGRFLLCPTASFYSFQVQVQVLRLCLHKKKKRRIASIASGKFFHDYLQVSAMGTRELQEILNREGIDISLRTIQRDLNQISLTLPY